MISSVYFSFLSGLSEGETQVLLPLFMRPSIEPEFAQCEIKVFSLFFTSTKNLLYLFWKFGGINLFLNFIMNFSKEFTSAILIIGNEILSGRTVDKNTSFIAKWLGELGISVEEVRVIPDKESVIINTLNELRKKYQYVFTTGGIGPTHDDITSESVAKAFEKKCVYNKEAYAILEKYYANSDFNEGRKKMAKMPEGAKLIYNEQGSAPAFYIENVFVLPGIPSYVELSKKSKIPVS